MNPHLLFTRARKAEPSGHNSRDRPRAAGCQLDGSKNLVDRQHF
jgi:hypothetical protein